jgi:hypothetical protein
MEKDSSTHTASAGTVEDADNEYLRLLEEFRRMRSKYGYNCFYTRECERELLEAWDRVCVLNFSDYPILPRPIKRY